MVKVNDYVKIDGQGIGKIEALYPADDCYETGTIKIRIGEQSYYRDIDANNEIKDELNDTTPATTKEYMTYLKLMIKQLTEQSKTKRKQAAEYNKMTEGQAVSRKGKVQVENGHIMGFVENALSTHHRNLLTNAKQAKALKEKLKQELKYLKLTAI